MVDRQTCGRRRDGLEQARLAGPLSGDAVNNEGTSVIRIARVFAAAFCAAVGVMGSAQAADYPTRPVKWVVPYPPGGTTDVLARIVAEWLTQKMGQTFIIENKPGAGNNIGVESVDGPALREGTELHPAIFPDRRHGPATVCNR